MQSQSSTISCKNLANSNILSISCCTSAMAVGVEELLAPELLAPADELATLLRVVAGLDTDRLLVPGVLTALLLAADRSAVTRVIMIRLSKRCFRKSNMAFCIMSVTSKPFNDGPTITTGLIDGTTS